MTRRFLILSNTMALLLVSGAFFSLVHAQQQAAGSPTNQTTANEKTKANQPADSKVQEKNAATSKRSENPIVRTGRLNDDELLESSGLALASSAKHYWTINDSGCPPILFRISENGTIVQRVELDAKNQDWEALGRIVVDQQAWLIVADVGDNLQKRGKYQLYFAPEPSPVDRKAKPAGKKIKPAKVRSLEFRFSAAGMDPADLKEKDLATRSLNCEAMSVDPLTGEIWLIEKVYYDSKQKTPPGIFVLPKPNLTGKKLVKGKEELIAARIGKFPIRNVTGMAFSPDGKKLVIRNYFNAHLYRRSETETWRETIAQTKPEVMAMPLQLQGEAICFTADSMSVMVTSERKGQPVWRVSLATYMNKPIRRKTKK